MSKKLPFVTSDIPRDLRTFLDRVREMITGTGQDKLVTVGDLVASGIANTDSGGALTPPQPSYGTPATPTNVTAAGAIQNIIVEWDSPLYAGHSHAEIWGSATDNIGVAVQVGMAPGAVFVDPVGPSVVRYYWVRFVNVLGAAGAFNAVAGARGETGSDVAYLLDTLAGQITESELYVDLNGRIDEIDGGPGGTTGLLSKYTVKVDLAGHVAGYGIAATANNGTPTSSFGVRADQFWVAPPSTVSATAPTSNLYVGYVWIDTSTTPNVTRYYNGSTWQTTQVKSAIPFVVQAAPTTVNGVAVPAGVYIDAAYIKNGTITNAKIANATIDDAKIVTLTASKITAGSISTGDYIQSTSFISGTQGWRISGNGTAEFGAASIRGLITAAQIDSRGLSIKDASGNIILAAGSPLSVTNISGLPAIATRNWDFTADTVSGWTNVGSVDSSDPNATDGVRGIVTAATSRAYPDAVAVAPDRAYLARVRLFATTNQTVDVGVLCFDSSMVEIVAANTPVRADCMASQVVLPANTYVVYEAVITGEQLTSVSAAARDRFKFLQRSSDSKRTAYAAPYVVGSTTAGALYVDFVELADVTDAWSQAPNVRPHAPDLGMAFGPGYAVKVNGTAAYNAGIKSVTSLTGGFLLAVTPKYTDKVFAIGVNADPDTDAILSGLDYALVFDASAGLSYSESGTSASLGTYAAGDALSIHYDGATLRYLKNGAVLRSVAPPTAYATTPVYLDSSFYTFGASAYGIQFQAAGTSGLVTKLNSDARNVLAGAGGLATGSLTWDANGNRLSGYGVGFTQNGIAAYNAAGTATFSLNGTTGAATFAGALSAATGSFAGSLSAVTGTFSGSLTADAIAAVNTINLAGQAVTLPQTTYDGADKTVTTSWTTLLTITVTSTGAPVYLFGCSNFAYGYGTFILGIFVGGTRIIEASQQYGGSCAISRGITLSAGSHTITLQAINVSGVASGFADNHSLLFLETKR